MSLDIKSLAELSHSGRGLAILAVAIAGSLAISASKIAPLRIRLLLFGAAAVLVLWTMYALSIPRQPSSPPVSVIQSGGARAAKDAHGCSGAQINAPNSTVSCGDQGR
jgi:hypothetical protein